jgi:hypothetical protein
VHGRRVDPRPLERFPRRLQQEPLLRVHRECLAGHDAEELGVELGGVVEESALAGIGFAGQAGFRVVDAVAVPPAVGGELRDGVAALGDEVPEILGRPHATGETAAHRHDRDQVVVGHGRRRGQDRGGRGDPGELALQVVGHRPRGRVVEDEGGRKAQAGGAVQQVPQLDRGE